MKIGKYIIGGLLTYALFESGHPIWGFVFLIVASFVVAILDEQGQEIDDNPQEQQELTKVTRGVQK